MRDRLEAVLRDPSVQRAGDVVVAVLLALSSVVPILVRGDPSWGTDRPLAVMLALASTVPVACRVRWPVPAALVVLVATGGAVIAAVPHQGAFQPFVALVLVAYAVGSHAEGRSAMLAPPALAGIAAGLFVAAVVHGQAGGNVVPSFVWLSAAWLVGRIVCSWRRRSVELDLLNRELEGQRELRAQAAVAVERGRIARELHDVIAHNVSMVVVQAGAAASVLEGEQPHVRAALEAIETTGRATVDEMRRLLGVLRQSEDGAALAPQPGLAGLETLVAGVREAGLPVDLRIEGSPRQLPSALDLTAYRIAQEALTNVLKHAGPARAALTVRYDAAAVEIELRDDGAGGRSNGAGGGHGLIGMRERVALWGGTLDAGGTERGWLVRARLPLGPAT
jgi:signal transduction histidine kinase